MPFQQLNLLPNILKVLQEEGYSKPTPIQSQAIPKILEGCDLFASAQTGTGKTAAFMLPSLQKLSTPSIHKGKGPRILVLVPTRELAMQVASQSVKYSKYLQKMSTVCLYGGVPYPVQNRQLARPHEILVATPGRLIDHLESKRVDFSRVEMFILDEADRMLDMGFIEAVEHIADQIPHKVQTLLFSATLKRNVLKLAQHLLKDPLEVHVKPEVQEHASIQQFMHFTSNLGQKRDLLDKLLAEPDVIQTVIFTSTKSYAAQLSQELREQGQPAEALHGDLHQRKRTKTINAFREGKVRILVATDVAARGIDVRSVSHVINFDLPNNAEDYVHRIGRTGRAEAKGVAISFVSNKDRPLIKEIEKLLGTQIPIVGGEKKSLEQKQPHAKKEKSHFSKKAPTKTHERRFVSDDRRPRKTFSRRNESEGESQHEKSFKRGPEKRFGSDDHRPRKTFSRRNESEGESQYEKPFKRGPERRFMSDDSRPRKTFSHRNESEGESQYEKPFKRGPERRFMSDDSRPRKTFSQRNEFGARPQQEKPFKRGPERRFMSDDSRPKKTFFQRNETTAKPQSQRRPARTVGRFNRIEK